MLEPPVKQRFRAPKAFEPRVRPDVAAAHEALIGRVHLAAEFDDPAAAGLRNAIDGSPWAEAFVAGAAVTGCGTSRIGR